MLVASQGLTCLSWDTTDYITYVSGRRVSPVSDHFASCCCVFVSLTSPETSTDNTLSFKFRDLTHFPTSPDPPRAIRERTDERQLACVLYKTTWTWILATGLTTVPHKTMCKMTFNWGQRPRKLNVIRVSKPGSVDLWREAHPGWPLLQEKAFTGTTLSSLNSVNLTFLSWLVIYFLKVSLTSLRLPWKAMKWAGLGHMIHCPHFDQFGCFAGFNNVQKNQ